MENDNLSLRVVQIKAILFWKSMSERGGSAIERLWFWMKIDFASLQKFIIQFQSRCMSDPNLSDIDFKNKMTWVWTTLKNENFEFSRNLYLGAISWKFSNFYKMRLVPFQCYYCCYHQFWLVDLIGWPKSVVVSDWLVDWGSHRLLIGLLELDLFLSFLLCPDWPV